MKYKVLLDTNVLISASIYMTVEGSQAPVVFKHRFFDNCMQLLGMLIKHTRKSIGILTATVEDEALATIERAVETEVNKSQLPRETLFKTLSLVLTRCQDRMQELIRSLQRDAVVAKDVDPFYQRVITMYNGFVEEAKEIDVRWDAATKSTTASRPLRSLARSIYQNQSKTANRQVLQLRYDRPNDTDKMILAEAAYLRTLYKEREGNVEFYFASSDTHFSPMRATGGGGALDSRSVTDRILDEFGVICDWPLEVAVTLESKLK